MTGVHPDLGVLGPEMRKLAQTILDGLEPAVRSAAALASAGGVGAGAGKCQQVWCPVCALAALVAGEQHPLLTVIAEHSVALLAVIRAMVDDINRSPTPPPDSPAGDGPTDTAGESVATSRYQHIPVNIQE